jgi:hypothetical protein
MPSTVAQAMLSQIRGVRTDYSPGLQCMIPPSAKTVVAVR